MLRSFIVHVYLADEQGLTGEVETLASRAKEPFRSSEELWRILKAGADDGPRINSEGGDTGEVS